MGGATSTFAYDRSGVMTSRTDPAGSTSFAVDRYGNLTSAATAYNVQTAYAYDLGDRMTSLTPPGASAGSYTYDALGRPLTRVSGGVTTSYAYLGSSDRAWEVSAGGVTTRAALDPTGAGLAVQVGATTGFSLPDLHANAAALVNTADDAYLDALRYDGYGQTIADAAPSFTSPWAFQGRLDLAADAANPLYDFGARRYAPSLGVFTQLDSYGGSAADPLSLNRYLYAEANPWTLIDPSGHYAEASAGSGSQTIEQYRAGQVLRRAALARAALTTLHNHDVASSQIAKRDQGVDPFGVLGTAWNATGGQVVGFGQGLVGGGVDAVSGVATTAWEGGWWLYHSTAAYAVDNHAFNEQWDTNIAVGRYLKENPGEALGATWHGIVDPIADHWAAGNGGQASGRAVFEVGSVALGFGALAKAAKARFAVEAVGEVSDVAAISARLQQYASSAARAFDRSPMTSLTRAQRLAQGRNPRLFSMYRGYQIDRAAKQLAMGDRFISSSGVSMSLGRGPDFLRVGTNDWWDMTTTGQWQMHLDKYDNFGHFVDINR